MQTINPKILVSVKVSEISEIKEENTQKRGRGSPTVDPEVGAMWP